MYFPILNKILSNKNINEVRTEFDKLEKQITELKTYIEKNKDIQNRNILHPCKKLLMLY